MLVYKTVTKSEEIRLIFYTKFNARKGSNRYLKTIALRLHKKITCCNLHTNGPKLL